MKSRTVVASGDCRLQRRGDSRCINSMKIHRTNANRKQHHDTVRELWLSFVFLTRYLVAPRKTESPLRLRNLEIFWGARL